MGLSDLAKGFQGAPPSTSRGRGKPSRRNQAGIIGPHLASWLREQVEEERTGYHPSSIYRLCPRATGLNVVFPRTREQPSPGLRQGFDIGNAVHGWFQERYLGPMGVLRGGWFCLCCGEIWGTAHKRGKKLVVMPTGHKCEAAGKLLDAGLIEDSCDYIRFIEPGVSASNKWVEGHCDGIYKAPDGTEYVLEMKTMNPDQWDHIKAPLPQHLKQIECYMREFKLPGLIVYINKGRIVDDPLHDFVVECDDASWRDIREVIREDRKVVAAIEDDKLPIMGRLCGTPNDKRARYCPWIHECFDDIRTPDLIRTRAEAGGRELSFPDDE